MSNLATTLKGEISRIARKETKQQVNPLRSATTRHRSEIAELKRQLATVQKELARISKQAARATPAQEPGGTEGQYRYREGTVAGLRKRLGLTAVEFGVLMGVTQQTVYNWEGGARPRHAQLATLAELRKIGKREARIRVDAAGAKATNAAPPHGKKVS
jgi:DNA-binding XRE family transcriptional regulator